MQNQRKKIVNTPFLDSELILNRDGSVYHLNLRADQIADHIITVGDQERVSWVSAHFDTVEHRVQHREFITHTGTYKGKRMTVISSGIGPDNIDIMLQELDAAVNINPITRLPNELPRKLQIIRLGTSGALQPDIEVDSFIVSSYAVGLDGAAHFYDLTFEPDEVALNTAMDRLLPADLNRPYTVRASQLLQQKLKQKNQHSTIVSGITLTAGGFYAPQGRSLMLNNRYPDLTQTFERFEHLGERLCNFEMESSMLFALGSALGHECASILNIIANRYKKQFSADPQKSIHRLIEHVLSVF